MQRNNTERAKLVAAMEYLVRQVNDEDILEGWLMNGVPDGDIEYGDLRAESVDEYWLEDEHFADLMGLFLRIMSRAKKDGGLYCNGVVSNE